MGFGSESFLYEEVLDMLYLTFFFILYSATLYGAFFNLGKCLDLGEDQYYQSLKVKILTLLSTFIIVLLPFIFTGYIGKLYFELVPAKDHYDWFLLAGVLIVGMPLLIPIYLFRKSLMKSLKSELNKRVNVILLILVVMLMIAKCTYKIKSDMKEYGKWHFIIACER